MSWAEAEQIAAAEGLTFVQNDRSKSGYLGVNYQVKQGRNGDTGAQDIDCYFASVTRKQLGETGPQNAEQRFLGQYGSVARAANQSAFM